MIYLILTIFVVIFFGSNFFIGFSFIHFFRITDPVFKKVIYVIFLLLPLLFIQSSILSLQFDNTFTKLFYTYTSIWLGVLTNLLVTFTIVWILFFICKIFGYFLASKIVPVLAIVVAIFISYNGIQNAKNPIIKNINVSIKNLPISWKQKTVVFISDIHIGQSLSEDFLEKTVQKINSVNPDIVFITGDLFDGSDGNLEIFTPILKKIQTKDGIYFVTGNHETYLGLDKVFSVLKDSNIKILNDEMVNISGMQIIGFSYPNRLETKNFTDVIKKIKGFNPKIPSILLYHAPTGINEAEKIGINLQLAGHSHAGQLFPLNFITNILYKGYDYGLHTIGNYSIYTTSGVGTWGPPMKTAKPSEIVVIKFK